MTVVDLTTVIMSKPRDAMQGRRMNLFEQRCADCYLKKQRKTNRTKRHTQKEWARTLVQEAMIQKDKAKENWLT